MLKIILSNILFCIIITLYLNLKPCIINYIFLTPTPSLKSIYSNIFCRSNNNTKWMTSINQQINKNDSYHNLYPSRDINNSLSSTIPPSIIFMDFSSIYPNFDSDKNIMTHAFSMMIYTAQKMEITKVTNIYTLHQQPSSTKNKERSVYQISGVSIKYNAINKYIFTQDQMSINNHTSPKSQSISSYSNRYHSPYENIVLSPSDIIRPAFTLLKTLGFISSVVTTATQTTSSVAMYAIDRHFLYYSYSSYPQSSIKHRKVNGNFQSFSSKYDESIKVAFKTMKTLGILSVIMATMQCTWLQLFVYAFAFNVMSSQSTTDTICIYGSSLRPSVINGEYVYHSWNKELNGTVYYNTHQNKYLYPWINSSNSKYYLISNNTNDTIYTKEMYGCHIPLTSNPMTPYDCYNGYGQQIGLWDGTQFVDDDAGLIECPVNRPNHVGQEIKNWTEAKDYCEQLGSNLAIIRSELDRSLAGVLCGTAGFPTGWAGFHKCWIGLYHDDANSAWKWVDGSELNYGFNLDGTATNSVDPWKSLEPNSDSEDCVELMEHSNTDGYQWNDLSCTTEIYPICSSNNPTAYPTTNEPTGNPTANPTYCEDYDTDISSDKGNNEYQYGDEVFNITQYQNKLDQVSALRYIASMTNNYIIENIKCKDVDCYIECDERASCLLSNITIDYVQNETMRTSPTVLISCSNQISCLRSTITATSASENMDVLIICNGTDSCEGMEINANKFKSMNILCLQAGSCQDMIISLNPLSENGTNLTNPINETNNDGNVYCIVPNACDNLYLTTNSIHTKLVMYEYSKDVRLDNNIGYLSNLNNVVCNTDRYIKYKSWTTETEETISETIHDEYISDEYYPCQGVEVICNTSSCNMEYSINSAKMTKLEADTTTDCYWLNIEEIQDIVCIGGCISSPTEDPTPAPTKYPTLPSKTPTIDPTSEPTFDPTAYPSFDPTTDPSIEPTANPTYNPTVEPTIDPSTSPTASPSTSPSISPSTAPTRTPTISDAYDYYVKTVYNIRGLTDFDISEMAKSVINTTDDITIIIEEGYVNHYAGSAWELNYFEFMIYIERINEEIIEDIANNQRPASILSDGKDGMELSAHIRCSQFIGNYIIAKYNEKEFEKTVTTKLQEYFDSMIGITNAENEGNGSSILFTVESMADSAELLNPLKPEEIPYVFYCLAAITILIGIIGLLAWVWNKISEGIGKNIVDNAKWLSVMIFALQFWDFASDINLAIEIWYRDDVWQDIIVLLIAFGSVFFILIPYTANLYIAARIKSIIKDNEAAKSWFQAYTALFCGLVVLTGGCYPALALVSSNVFGLKLLNSGLTKYELGKLSKIKVFGTVFLENVPQLIIQAAYAVEIAGVTQAVGAAFIASILSVIASTLGYYIDRDTKETIPVQYYVTIQRKKSDGDPKKKEDSYDDDDDSEPDRRLTIKTHVSHKNITTILPPKMGQETREINPEHITNKEEMCIIKNQGRTEALEKSLAGLCEIQPKAIEIGSTLIHKTGAKIHIVHYVYKSDLEIMQTELAEMGQNVTVTANLWTKQLHSSLSKEMKHIFLDHFALDIDKFDVGYYDLTAMKRQKAKKHFSVDNPLKSSGILRRMVTYAGSNQNEEKNDNDLKDKFEYAVKQYFNHGNDKYNVKKEEALKLIETLNVAQVEEDGSVIAKEEKSIDADGDSVEMVQFSNGFDEGDGTRIDNITLQHHQSYKL